MLHYFIVNPTAGRTNALPQLKEQIEQIFSKREEQYFIYETKCQNDATLQIKKVIQDRNQNNPTLHIRFIQQVEMELHLNVQMVLLDIKM